MQWFKSGLPSKSLGAEGEDGVGVGGFTCYLRAAREWCSVHGGPEHTSTHEES